MKRGSESDCVYVCVCVYMCVYMCVEMILFKCAHNVHLDASVDACVYKCMCEPVGEGGKQKQRIENLIKEEKGRKFMYAY